MFDTGGGERAKSLTQQYYKNAHIVCLVYAVDSEISFNALGKWVEDARFYLEESQRHSKSIFGLVGIKSDISPYEREVKLDDVRQAAQHFGIPLDCCFEVSNVTGDGIAQMIQQLTQKTFDLHTKQITESVTELQSYSTEHDKPHDTITGETVTLKQWLCHCCCCCCCCCGRYLKQQDYQPLPHT